MAVLLGAVDVHQVRDGDARVTVVKIPATSTGTSGGRDIGPHDETTAPILRRDECRGSSPSGPSCSTTSGGGGVDGESSLVTRDALIAATLARSVARPRSLEDVLVDQGALDPADRDLLRPNGRPLLHAEVRDTGCVEAGIWGRPLAFASRPPAVRAAPRCPVCVASVDAG